LIGADAFVERKFGIFSPIAKYIKDVIIDAIRGDWESLFDNTIGRAARFADDTKKTFGSIRKSTSQTLSSLLEGDFETFWASTGKGFSAMTDNIRSMFEGLPLPIRLVFDSVLAKTGGLLEYVTAGINGVFANMNKMLGIEGFSVQPPKVTAPRIPMLARGGIVDRPTLAMIGERGREAVMPLENNTGWIADLANMIGSVVGMQLAMNQSKMYQQGGRGQPIQLNIDGHRIAEAIMDDLVGVAQRRDLRMRFV